MQSRLVGRVAKPATLCLALQSARAERNEKCRTSSGCQARKRLETRCLGVVVPRLDLDLGVRAMRDLLVGVEDRLLRRPDAPGAARRTVMRSAKKDPSSGRGRKWRQQPRTTPYRSGTVASTSFNDPPRGHQNSSASAWSTQSASCSVAASRAMRVTHSAWRMSSLGSRRSRSTARALVPLENLGRPVARGVVRRDHEVDAGVQVVRELRVDDVRLVAREERHDELHGASLPRPSTTASTTRSAARPSTVPTTCSTARRRSAASSSGRSSARSIPATTSSKLSAR